MQLYLVLPDAVKGLGLGPASAASIVAISIGIRLGVDLAIAAISLKLGHHLTLALVAALVIVSCLELKKRKEGGESGSILIETAVARKVHSEGAKRVSSLVSRLQ